MKKLVMALTLVFGLAFASGSETRDCEVRERVVELSKIDWADVQRGMAVSNCYHFVESRVTIVVTNKVEDVFPVTLQPYRPAGRGAKCIEPQDYLK